MRANRHLVAPAGWARRAGGQRVAQFPRPPPVPGVFPDSTAVGGLLAEHLLARGFRNFASLSAHNNVDHELEVKEFVRVVNEAGFLCLSQRIPQNPWKDLAHWQKTERLITQWMDGWQHPIGVHVGGEGEGRMVTQECHRRGWRMPADAAIIAGKNQELLCEHPRPSLTSIEIGYERIGYEAAHLLDGMMEGEPAPPEPIRLPPHRLVVRESTDFFAVENPVVAAALRIHLGEQSPSYRAGRRGPCGRRRDADVAEPLSQDDPSAHCHRGRRVRISGPSGSWRKAIAPFFEIARDVGFGASIRMCEVFRRELGVTPSAYRKQRQMEYG